MLPLIPPPDGTPSTKAVLRCGCGDVGCGYVTFTIRRAGEVIMPCGRCRQLLFEHGGQDLLLLTVSGVRPMSEVLPDAFGPDDLEGTRG